VRESVVRCRCDVVCQAMSKVPRERFMRNCGETLIRAPMELFCIRVNFVASIRNASQHCLSSPKDLVQSGLLTVTAN
jgi:hypothetical protein